MKRILAQRELSIFLERVDNPLVNSLRDFLEVARTSRRDSRMTVAVIVTLGIAIGASALVYGVVEALLLRSPFVREPDELVVMWEEDLDRDRHLWEVSFSNFEDWKLQAKSFESMAAMAFHDWAIVLLEQSEPERIPYRAVAASFFDTLGAEPLLGRTFVAADDEPEAERVVVLSYGLWQRRFGADPGIVGRALTFESARGGEPFTVVGVMPKEFQFPSGSQLWAPAGREMAEIQESQGLSDDTMRWIGVFNVLGRLKPGVSLEQAEAEMDSITGRIAETIDRRHGAVLTPFVDFLAGRTRTALFALIAAVGMLVLIACANVANLLAFRALSRQRAFAIRLALGASRTSIARVLFAESLLLSAGGAALGLVLARAGVDSVLAIAPANLPQLSEVSIDASVVTFAVLLALLTAVLSSILPIARTESSMKRGPSVSGGLVVWETALAVVVLVGAGLAAKSFFQLSRADLGFEPRGVVSFGVSPSDLRYSDGSKRKTFYSELLERLRALPGVDAVGAVLVRPYRLGVIGQDGWILTEGQPEEARRENPVVNWQVATPDYFRAMGILLSRGRDFGPLDDERTPPVAVVGESLARRMWPGQDPIGRRLRTLGLPPGEDGQPPWVTVVGVVADVRYRELDRARLNLYLSYRQVDPSPEGLNFVVRTSAEPISLAGALAREVRSLDPDEPVDSIASMEEVVWEAQAPWRFASVLFSSFALVAIGLTGLGVFSVLSRSVSERKRELGVRMAIGARVAHILRLTVGRAMKWTIFGLSIGLAFAFPAVRLMGSLLFEVEPADPAVFSATGLFVLAVGLFASWIPARRAAAIDPSEALKSD
ncbi:MAG: ABC transporter permease [Vicinamibacteria bacterium]